MLETAPCRTNGRMHASLESRWRIDRHLMKLVVAAMRCGAWSVMSTDDLSPMSWREALQAGEHTHTHTVDL